MLSESVYKKIQRFHFTTRRMADDLFAGQYVSAFKGRGMAFSEVREYQIGDDIRTIDWNVSARFGRPYVKVFHEERELTVMLVLDLSGSLLFGTRNRFKRELMAEAAGMLAFLAIRTNDKVGALLFSSRVEKYIPPRKGASHVWRLIKEIFTHEPEDLRTDLGAALTYLNRVLKRRSIVFLLSDFLDQGFEKPLKLTARKHDLTVIRVKDPAEDHLPDVGLVSLEDPETGEMGVFNLRSRALRDRWGHWRKEQEAGLNALFRRADVNQAVVSTHGPLVQPLIQLFEKRKKRL